MFHRGLHCLLAPVLSILFDKYFIIYKNQCGDVDLIEARILIGLLATW